MSVIERLDFTVDKHFVLLGAANIRDGEDHALGIGRAGEKDAILLLDLSSRNWNSLRNLNCYWFNIKDRREIGAFHVFPELDDSLRVFVRDHHVLKERQEDIQITKHNVLVGNRPGQMRPVVSHLHHIPNALAIAGGKVSK